MSSAGQDDRDPGHWSAVAQRWRLIGSPLRPSPADCAAFMQAIALWSASHGAPRALILGVTPELQGLPWPPGSSVLAVDHTQEMIDALWSGPKASALHAEWTQLPLAAGSVDIALCDGGFHLLAHPEQQALLVQALARVLAPLGLFVVRLFVPPEQRETAEAVLTDLERGAIANLNVLKLRLGMALQGNATQGVQLHQVWTTLSQRHPDLALLAKKLGWDLAHLQAIDTYRNCLARYHFVSVAEAEALLCATGSGFELVSVHTCSYDLGERCPLVVFRRKPMPVAQG